MPKMDEAETPAKTALSETHESDSSGTASIVIASFASRRGAERMVASLGHSFRHMAHNGSAAAFVVTRSHDGSFKLVQSRVITASGVVATTTIFAAEIMVGLIGIGAMRKGAKGAKHRVHQRQSGVGRDDQRLAEVFDRLGDHGACVLFSCSDEQMAQAVAKRADERGDRSSHYARTQFLALLDRLGTDYDWVRPAIAEPAAKEKKHSKLRRHSKTRQS
jgi:uncharacterized membrane protein